MRQTEREQIREAIRLIHADEQSGGDYHSGMQILCRLVGIPFPDLTNLREVSLAELFGRSPNYSPNDASHLPERGADLVAVAKKEGRK
jgi:hypothetical protein